MPDPDLIETIATGAALEGVYLPADLCRQVVARLESDAGEIARLRALLAEASSWLCHHPGAAAYIEANPRKGYWCPNCETRVVCLKRATLTDRIAAALKESK